MDRDRRIEMEVNASVTIASILLERCLNFVGEARIELARDVPRRAALCAHELVEMVLHNNRENLGQDE